MEIPKHIKHYNFMKPVIETLTNCNYDDFMEECRIKEVHNQFLIKYKLGRNINWYF